MHDHLKSLTRFPRLAFLLLIGPLLLTGGCGGGGSSPSSTTTTATVVAPKNLIGAVIVMNYADGRSFTFTFNSANANGVSRSDGRVTTNWIGDGYVTPVLAINLAYGAFIPGSLDNVFDAYALTFSTATTGVFALRENTTSNTFASTAVIFGTFTITTYPPNG